MQSIAELDCRPIYLGYDVAKNKYYFYALKAGVARFLVYVTYFYWDRGPENALEMRPIPEDIENELGLFLEGRVSYEFKKKRINSRRRTVNKTVHQYRLPGEIFPSPEVSSGKSLRKRTRRSGTSDTDGSGGEYSTTTREVCGSTPEPVEAQEVKQQEIKPERRRRAKAPVVDSPSPEQVIPKRRGRPPKVKPVEVMETKVQETVAEAPKKRSRKKDVKEIPAVATDQIPVKRSRRKQ